MKSLIFVQCFINPKQLNSLDDLRPTHLEYIASCGGIFSFAGVVLTDDQEYAQICYFLDVPSRAEAEDFVRNDPYSQCYDHVEIYPFAQRFPQLDNEHDA